MNSEQLKQLEQIILVSDKNQAYYKNLWDWTSEKNNLLWNFLNRLNRLTYQQRYKLYNIVVKKKQSTAEQEIFTKLFYDIFSTYPYYLPSPLLKVFQLIVPMLKSYKQTFNISFQLLPFLLNDIGMLYKNNKIYDYPKNFEEYYYYLENNYLMMNSTTDGNYQKYYDIMVELYTHNVIVFNKNYDKNKIILLDEIENDSTYEWNGNIDDNLIIYFANNIESKENNYLTFMKRIQNIIPKKYKRTRKIVEHSQLIVGNENNMKITVINDNESVINNKQNDDESVINNIQNDNEFVINNKQ